VNWNLGAQKKNTILDKTVKKVDLSSKIIKKLNSFFL